MRKVLLIAVVTMLPGMALAEGEGHKCVSPPFTHDPSPPVQLTSEQSAFLKGLWAGNKYTPPGLPYGADAAWIVGPNGGAVAFFVDGDMRCDALILDQTAVDMTMDIARGVELHAGESN